MKSACAYIVFEGMDGSGKTTLADRVQADLAGRDILCRKLGFPGRESAIGALIRDVFDGQEDVDPRAMMWLFVGEAVDMESTIREELDRGAIVLCDRHTAFSGLVYQTDLHERVSVEAVTHAGKLLVPDRVYVVDVPAEVALERRDTRGEDRNQLYEPSDVDRVNTQREKYRTLAAELPNAVLLDGQKTPDDLVAAVIADMGWET
jgi:dTMP kinase